ncbi:hypothetical protein IRJ41_002623 [Triplophysa rosa]|uniref:Uncharacterized protein n=1 Tax=Triplophysa rosa TaxID=992332 RepID=A0A9W7TDK2_TRIRA|nr:hypothetical protein IRJ41_002623 [Triplophysa rosa]
MLTVIEASTQQEIDERIEKIAHKHTPSLLCFLKCPETKLRGTIRVVKRGVFVFYFTTTALVPAQRRHPKQVSKENIVSKLLFKKINLKTGLNGRLKQVLKFLGEYQTLLLRTLSFEKFPKWLKSDSRKRDTGPISSGTGQAELIQMEQ